jgi:threonine aldolase
MRQAGIVAAGGLYALRHNVERLADDHARARRLARGLEELGVVVRGPVETNFVQIDVGADRTGALARLREEGVLLSSTIHPTVVRAVTHLDLTDADIDTAIERIPRALGALVGA